MGESYFNVSFSWLSTWLDGEVYRRFGKQLSGNCVLEGVSGLTKGEDPPEVGGPFFRLGIQTEQSKKENLSVSPLPPATPSTMK